MAARELVVLGTASQAPTRTRSHVAAYLRLDGAGVLLDCGEGAQRQLLLAGVSSRSIDRICVTHAHGDHCLGLPGVLQRMALDGARGPVPLHCPSSAMPRLSLLTQFAAVPPVEWHPASEAAAEVAGRLGAWTLSTRPLEHRVPAVGYLLTEDDGRTLLPDRLAAAGISGPDIGVLQREGSLRGVRLDDVSVRRPGQRVAFVMDTRLCEGAEALAQGVDLLVCEATFLHRDAALARDYLHLTARQAGRLACAAGARRLVLLHFSQRYPDLAEFVDEAGSEHDDVVVVNDLDVVPVPPRRPAA